MNYKPILIILLIIGAAFFVTDYMAIGQYTVTYDETVVDGQSFYVADGILEGRNEYLIVPSNAEKPMSISIDLVETKWVADLYDPATPLKYWESDNLIPRNKPVPYYSLSSIQKIDVTGKVNLVIPGEATQTKSISNILSQDGARRVKFLVDGKEIIVQFTDLKFTSGILPPVGTFSVLKEGDTSNYVLMPDSKMKEAISGSNVFDGWNTHYWILASSPTLLIINNDKINEWNDVWEWMANKGRLTPGEEIIEPGYDQTVDTYNKKYHAYYDTTDLSQGYEIFVPAELGYLVQVVDRPSFDFYSITDPECVEGGVAQVIIKGIATGSGKIRFTLGTDEIYRYDWISHPGGVINVEKGKEYTLIANLYSNDDDVIGNDDALHRIVCRANTDGQGDDSWETFYLRTTDNDRADIKKYTVTISAIKDASNSPVVTNAKIYFDGTVVSTDGTATVTDVIEGNHLIYSEDVTSWYAEYTVSTPLNINVDSNKNIEILFTTDPPKPKEDFEYNEILLIGGIAIVAIVLLSLIANELGAKITMNQIIVMVVLVGVAIVGYVILGIAYEMFDRVVTAIEDFKLV